MILAALVPHSGPPTCRSLCLCEDPGQHVLPVRHSAAQRILWCGRGLPRTRTCLAVGAGRGGAQRCGARATARARPARLAGWRAPPGEQHPPFRRARPRRAARPLPASSPRGPPPAGAAPLDLPSTAAVLMACLAGFPVLGAAANVAFLAGLGFLHLLRKRLVPGSREALDAVERSRFVWDGVVRGCCGWPLAGEPWWSLPHRRAGARSCLNRSTVPARLPPTPCLPAFCRALRAPRWPAWPR